MRLLDRQYSFHRLLLRVEGNQVIGREDNCRFLTE